MKPATCIAFPFILAALACEGAPSGGGASAASGTPAEEIDTAELAELKSEDDQVVLKAAKRIAADGDAATKTAAAPLLVEAVRRTLSKEWRARNRPRVMEANRISHLAPTEEQLEMQLEMYAAEVAGRLLMPLAAIGGPEATALLLEKAEDARARVELSKAAIDALKAHPPEAKATQDRVAAAKSALAIRMAPTAVATMAPDAAKRKASVALGGAVVEGGAVDNASAVVAAMAAGFRRCYMKALEDDASVKGTIKLTLNLDASGAVTSSTRDAKGLPETLASCVAARAAAASFARPTKVPASVTFPVSFALQE